MPPDGLGQAAAAPQPWQPPEEPAAWSEVRQALLRKGPPEGLRQRNWIFLRALDRSDLRAGEYLADLAPANETALPEAIEFNAVVLLQRPAQSLEWQVRERRMRVLCPQPLMQALDPSGAWVAYTPPPDPDNTKRMIWMCSRGK